jgi:hypothetical protein
MTVLLGMCQGLTLEQKLDHVLYWDVVHFPGKVLYSIGHDLVHT